MRARTLALLLLGACLVSSGTASAETVLGADGALYRVLTGSYGSLVPGGVEAAADDPVLVLEEERPDQAVRRFLVPGTGGGEVESSPNVLVEPGEDTVHVVWGSTDQVVHSSILLVSRRNGVWSDVIEVSGRPFTLKTAPRLAVTHDSFPFSIDSPWGRGWMQDRTVLHTVWWEESGSGGRVMYAPLTLINGIYTGEHEVFALNDFDGSAVQGGDPMSTDLMIAPGISPGDDLHTVVVAFANPETGRLVVLRLSALPFELTQLADSVEGFIAASEVGCDSESGRQALGASVVAHMNTVGTRFNSLALGAMVNAAVELVLDPAACSEGLQGLAEAARMHIVGVGARASLRLTHQLDGKARMHIVGVGLKSTVVSGEQHLSIALTASFPMPATGDGPTFLYASRDGSAVLVAWQDGSHLVYRETRDGAWTEPASIDIGSSMGLVEAQSVLRERIAGRSDVSDLP